MLHVQRIGVPGGTNIMAVKPQPWVYECDDCGWRKVMAPQSDCIMDAPIACCPRCKSNFISKVEVSLAELMAEKLVQLMTGRL
jgi:Zn finger protein HypA/HybF involved in hydrogenase expression